ncbi:MAG TPA: hypothetical protein ENH19_00070 [Actinobacteria bacterium]|nr:hypothetical protein [Actinomycetes bacterium]HEX21031.1 hypothetical protein [Actinomycetota bacterium]
MIIKKKRNCTTGPEGSHGKIRRNKKDIIINQKKSSRVEARRERVPPLAQPMIIAKKIDPASIKF